MKASDTVMGYAEILENIGLTATTKQDRGILEMTAKAQAEISFKAGEDSVREDWNKALDIAIAESYKAGIREVVEFVNDLIIGIEGCKFEERLDGDKGCIVLDMNENQWQAKLKEWGISEAGSD